MNGLPFLFQRTSDKCFTINDLGPRISEEDLWDLFEKHGKVKQIQIIRTNSVFGIIVFSAASVVENLKTKQLIIRDELLRVNEYSLSDYVEWKCQPILGDKFSMGGLATPTTFVEEWSSSINIRFDINILEKYIEIFFFHLNAQYRLRIVYNTVLKDTILQRSNNMSTVIIAAKYPAYFWRLISSQEPREAFDFSSWERVTEIPLNATNVKETSKNPVVPERLSNASLSLNNWSVYKVDLDINDKTHESLKRRLQEATEETLPAQTIQTAQGYKPRLDHEQYLLQFSFEVQYMLQHTLNLKILREYNIEDDFYQAISILEPHIACKLLSLISAGQHRLYDPNTAINNVFKKNAGLTDLPNPIPEGYAYLRKLLITPTSMYPLQPVVHRMNHLQYQHKKYVDRFLLVEFVDEELGPIVPSPHSNQNEKLYRRIFRVLKRGIVLAGRNYQFLCTSTEDLRLHRCWFFAPTDDFNRDDIIYWMGDFSEIKDIPSYISSIGQMTAPRLTDIDIKAKEIEEIDDYEHNGVNFSRGCGKMSPQVAREIASLLHLSYTPNVVQFNLAGAKGILMLSNFLQKRKVQLRSSQIRFNTPRLTVEVSKVSKKKTAYLNMHSISLLGGLGIQSVVFQQISEGIFQEYLIGSPHKESFLNDLMDEYYSQHFAKYFHKLIYSGFLERRDPLITNLVLAFQNEILRQIKDSGKLYVQNGARAFAIMDETGTLQDNEVFFQTSMSAGIDSEVNVIQGRCVIFCDSSSSAKDVVVMNAVDSPKLRSYTNVLVYPATGLKDLPSYCSNDDTNKDNFTIIWDRRLVPNRSNKAPRGFDEYKPPLLDKNLSFNDVAKFIVRYISGDSTSITRDAWLAAVDRNESSIYHGNASFMAGKLSIAQNFIKTGFSDILASDSAMTDLYEYAVPDFMKQNMLKSYMSESSLGYIHRTVQTIHARPYIPNQCEYDTRLYVDGMHEYILKARRSREKYDNSLRLLMSEHGVRSEIEFVSSIIVNWPKYMSKSSKKELTNNVRETFTQFKQEWRKIFESEFYEEEVQSLPEKELNRRVEAKAASWYYVTYHPNENGGLIKTVEIYNRCISFPWIVDDYISHIALKNTNRPILPVYREPVSESLINSQENINTTYIVEESDSE